VVNAILAKNLQRYLLVPTALGALSNVALNLYLIPRHGALGAAYATLISYSLAWFVALLAFRETRPLILQGLRWAIPAITLALGASWAAGLLPGSAGLKLIAGACLYAAGIMATRLFGRDDIEYAWAALAHGQTKPG
jgi:O-antigen/teichoic acid export membrane protein